MRLNASITSFLEQRERLVLQVQRLAQLPLVLPGRRRVQLGLAEQQVRLPGQPTQLVHWSHCNHNRC